MPPAQFIAKVAGSWTAATDLVTFATPTIARPGDQLLAVIACDTLVDDLVEGQDWETIGILTAGTARALVVRHICAGDEPASLSLQLDSVPSWSLSVLLVYRDLDDTAALVGNTASLITTSTNFQCPSQTLTTYSDLYLGIVIVTSAAVSVTEPAGTTERHDGTAGGVSKELEIFELLTEVTGATGSKTATTVAPQTGMAASIALKAKPTLRPAAIVPDVAGAIGLVTVGV